MKYHVLMLIASARHCSVSMDASLAVNDDVGDAFVANAAVEQEILSDARTSGPRVTLDWVSKVNTAGILGGRWPVVLPTRVT